MLPDVQAAEFRAVSGLNLRRRKATTQGLAESVGPLSGRYPRNAAEQEAVLGGALQVRSNEQALATLAIITAIERGAPALWGGVGQAHPRILPQGKG
ncbi:hypothetical protein ACU4GD_06570 [Cupriavidus basilensis]